MTAQRRIDRRVEVLQQLGEQIPARGGEPVPGAAVLRREQPEHQRQHHAGKELHPAVEPQVVGPQPDQQAHDAERDQRPEQQPCRPARRSAPRSRSARIAMNANASAGGPRTARVVRIPVVVGRAEAGQEHAEKEHAGRQVAAHRHSRPSAPTRMNGRLDTTFQKFGMPSSVCWSAKPVIDLRLRDRRNQQQAQQRNRRQDRTGTSADGTESPPVSPISPSIARRFGRLRSAFTAPQMIDDPGPCPYVPPALERAGIDVPPTGPGGRRPPPDSAMRPRAQRCFA